MGNEELQRRRAARLHEEIGRIEQEAKSEAPPELPSDHAEGESAENRRKAPASPLSPREFIHRRMRELDAEEGGKSSD